MWIFELTVVVIVGICKEVLTSKAMKGEKIKNECHSLVEQ